MIRIQKIEEPEILIINKVAWTNHLMDLVQEYGTYSLIPKSIRDAAIRYYYHDDIKNALIGVNVRAKCIYCESYVDITGYSNIEHFHPKSLFPRETFDWDNLFVGCTLCNTPKNDFDTVNEPFIHPVNEDPEILLTFSECMYEPRNQNQKAQNVIDKCNLQRLPLIRAHSDLLLSFYKSREALKERINKYNGHISANKKIKDAYDIYIALDNLKQEAADDSQYAGYMRYLLRKFNEIRNAVTIINNHKEDLGLATDFDWGFNYSLI